MNLTFFRAFPLASFLLAALLISTRPARAADGDVLVGFAKLDITPVNPVMLMGYGSRTTEAEDIDQRLHVRVIAFRDPEPGAAPILWVVIDNCAVSAAFTDSIHRRLADVPGLTRERFMLSVTHTHAAPMLDGTIGAIFGRPLTNGQARNVLRYTTYLAGRIETACRAALDDLKPATLGWTRGSAPFAGNRRVMKDGKWTGFGHTPDGAVDHRLPLLVVRSPEGELRGLIANYACHCTTTGGDHNRVHGDWAAYAAQQLEAEHPGSTALVVIGAGADANPEPRGTLEMAVGHGGTIATEVNRLLAGDLKPLRGAPAVSLTHASLPLDVYTEQQLKEMAEGRNTAYYATRQLENLARDGKLRDHVSLPVAVWSFGDDLAIVSLGGEVCVDYALMLYERHNADKLWVNAYTNDVPCYIPSRRIIAEGGYEYDTNMRFYEQPGVFNPAAEPALLSTVEQSLPAAFR